MKAFTSKSVFTAFLGIISIVLSIFEIRAEGPGVPKVTFPKSQLFNKIATIDHSAVGSPEIVSMINGYLTFVSKNGFLAYDISNPYFPKLVHAKLLPYDKRQRGVGFYKENGSTFVSYLNNSGVEIWDWTVIKNPTLIGRVDLPGLGTGGYENVVFMTVWQAPYIYAATTTLGIFIISTKDLKNPKIVKKVDVSQTGGLE